MVETTGRGGRALVMVSFPVEVWKQPRVPGSGVAYLDLVVGPRI